MLLQYCSDLHLEIDYNATFIEENPLEVAGDILVLAGDITSLRYYNARKIEKDFFHKLSKQFEQVYWICGNHEFYRSWDVSQLDKPFQISLYKNVHLLNNVSLIYKGTRLIFSTLWSYIGEIEGLYIQQNMSDFHLIRYQGSTLTTSIYTNKLHRPALQFITQQLQQPHEGTTIVVTHHLPSLQCVHTRYKGSLLNQGFASDLDALILNTQPDYWIYGHSHANMPIIEIGKTKLITNQLGYCAYGENKGFGWDTCLSLP